MIFLDLDIALYHVYNQEGPYKLYKYISLLKSQQGIPNDVFFCLLNLGVFISKEQNETRLHR